jgi:hypothetical protein
LPAGTAKGPIPALGERINKSLVLSVQSAIPVDLCVVELECAVGLANLDVHVVWSSKNLILESAVLALLTNIVDLVDYGSDSRVLVNQNLANDVLVRHVLITKIQMCNVTDESESRWDLVMLLSLREYGAGNFL